MLISTILWIVLSWSRTLLVDELQVIPVIVGDIMILLSLFALFTINERRWVICRNSCVLEIFSMQVIWTWSNIWSGGIWPDTKNLTRHRIPSLDLLIRHNSHDNGITSEKTRRDLHEERTRLWKMIRTYDAKICFLRILCTLSHQETAEDVDLDSSAYINVLAIFLTFLTSKIERLTASLIEITQSMTHTHDIEINLNDDNVIVTLKFSGTIFTWHVYFKSIHFPNIPCRPKDVHFGKKKAKEKYDERFDELSCHWIHVAIQRWNLFLVILIDTAYIFWKSL